MPRPAGAPNPNPSITVQVAPSAAVATATRRPVYRPAERKGMRMAAFMVRVELHGATEADYEVLHEAMEEVGFSRKVQGESRTWYHLPTAEYHLEGKYTTAAVIAKAQTA